MTNVDLEWRKSRMESDMTVHTAVALQNIWPGSDLVPHMEVAQIVIEKIRFHAVCVVHTVMTKRDLSHVWAKKSGLGHICLQCERSLSSSSSSITLLST